MSKDPFLHLKLDHAEGQVVADQSGNGYDGTLMSGAYIEADETFGACLRLDGSNDYVDLPPAALPVGSKLTVSFWAFGDQNITNNSVIYGEGSSGQRVLNIHLPHGGYIYFDCGVSGSYDRIYQSVLPSVTSGSWQYWAFRKDADSGLMDIWLNGELWLSGANKFKGLTPVTRLVLSNRSIGPYPGKISNLRIYDQVLSQAEIRRDMNADLSAQASFQMLNPLAFRLWNEEELEVLFITDDPQGHPMSFEVTNTSAGDILFPAGSGPAGPANTHLELRFRPNTLSATCKQRLDDLSFPGWAFHQQGNADLTWSLFFLSTTALTLNKGEAARLIFLLEGMGAEAAEGTRGTRVEMRYAGLNYPGDSTAVTGHRMIQLDIINMRGNERIPLNFSFAGSHVILNDGGSQNELELRVTNLMNDKPLALLDESFFVLSFEVQGQGQDRPWALATASEADNAVVTVIEPGSGWQVTKDNQAPLPTWVIGPNADTAIAPGEALVLKLSAIVSSLPTGQTCLYLRYHNIPGYQDGYQQCLVEKSPLITRGQKVGIGIANPQQELDVDGNTYVRGRLGIRTNPTASSVDLAVGDNDTGLKQQGDGELAIYTNAYERVRVDSSGRVGIGTNNPGQKLEVKGTAQVTTLRFNSGDTLTSNGYGVNVQNPQMTGGSLRLGELFGELGLYSGDGGTNYDLFLVAGPNKSVALAANSSNPTSGNGICIKTDHKVGIGTYSPSELLHVNGDARVERLAIRTTASSSAVDLAVGDSDTGLKQKGANQLAVVTAGSERMRVNNYGNVGIGTTSPGAKLHVNGTARVNNLGIGTNSPSLLLHLKWNNNNQNGIRMQSASTYWDIKIEANDTGDPDLLFVWNSGSWASGWIEPRGGFGQPSDATLKENIQPVKDALEDVDALNPVTFHWKTDQQQDRRYTGFIAQEVEEVLPDMVRHKNGLSSLVYSEFGVVAIAAIKELHEKVKALEVEMAELREKLKTPGHGQGKPRGPSSGHGRS